MEYGEIAEQAFRRELKEELDLKIKDISFAGAMENLYEEDGDKHHEIFFVFRVRAENVHDRSREDHIDFFFLSKKEMERATILPIPLKKILLSRKDPEQLFWESEYAISPHS